MGTRKDTQNGGMKLREGADWQELMRRNMENYGEAEPEGLWAAVASGLKAGAVSRRRRRFYYGAGAFAVAAAALALFLILPLPSRLAPVTPEAVAVAELPASETGGLPVSLPGDMPESGRASGSGALPPVVSVDEPEPDCVEAPVSAALDPDSSVAAAGDVGPVAAEGDALRAAGVDTGISGTEDAGSLGGASGEGAGSRVDVSGEGDASSAALELEEYLRELETKEARARSGRTRLAVALSGAVGTSSSSSSGYDAFYGSSVPMSLNSPIVGNLVSQQFSAVLLENNNRSVSSDRRFYQPVALELSLAHDIGPRLDLQGGLAYTCLISELVSGSESTHYDTRQSVHMLGVPLKLGVHLFDNQLFELNVSAGGMLEKALYARSVTRFVFEGQKPVSASTRLSDDPLYWSVNASFSALYKLSRNVGIYFEPGLSYHFRNGSFVETIYQARPLNLQLTLGLRFAL